jgi:hypothetical protein
MHYPPIEDVSVLVRRGLNVLDPVAHPLPVQRSVKHVQLADCVIGDPLQSPSAAYV